MVSLSTSFLQNSFVKMLEMDIITIQFTAHCSVSK